MISTETTITVQIASNSENGEPAAMDVPETMIFRVVNTATGEIKLTYAADGIRCTELLETAKAHTPHALVYLKARADEIAGAHGCGAAFDSSASMDELIARNKAETAKDEAAAGAAKNTRTKEVVTMTGNEHVRIVGPRTFNSIMKKARRGQRLYFNTVNMTDNGFELLRQAIAAGRLKPDPETLDRCAAPASRSRFESGQIVLPQCEYVVC